MILRPFGWLEFVWAASGAALLGLLPWTEALAGIARGADVYLFLVGMMLLAELARQEGLFGTAEYPLTPWRALGGLLMVVLF